LRASGIINPKRNTVIIAKIELRQISLQVLGADMMIGTSNATLQNGEVAFNRVRMHVAANILANAVIDGLMAGEHLADASATAIAHYVGRGVKLSVQDRAKRVSAHGRDMMATDGAAALDKGENSFLSLAADIVRFTLAAMLVRFLAANVSFVNLNGLAFAAHDEFSFAQAMADEPSGFEGATKGPVQLIAAYALLAGAHQKRSLKPLVQFEMAALEYCPLTDGELAPAVIAFPKTKADAALLVLDAL
jgi:hypothetical protein